MRFTVISVLMLIYLPAWSQGVNNCQVTAKTVCIDQSNVNDLSQVSCATDSGVRGLEGLNLDSWMKEVFEPAQTEANRDSNPQKIILDLYSKSTDVADFYQKLIGQKLPEKFNDLGGRKKLVGALLAARKNIRLTNEPKARGAIALLQTLAEETLYASTKQFPNQIPIWKSVFTDADLVAGVEKKQEGRSKYCYSSEGTYKVAVFKADDDKGVKVCQGDVLLSKGDAGTSSFIARMSDVPGNYSHSTSAYVDENKKLYLLEAEIEDGVKQRDPAKDYIDHHKTKLAIYRYKGKDQADTSDQIQKVIHGVELFHDDMVKKSGGDPINNVSYPYNFSMNADDNSKLFCSQVSYYEYNLAGAKNPYEKSKWSTVSGGTGVLAKSLLNINESSFPAPGDVELNSNFDEVAALIVPSQLRTSRFDEAMIDVFIQELQTHPDVVKKYLLPFEKIGNRPLTKEDIETIKAKYQIPPEVLSKIEGKIPENINLKQVVFFYALNDQIMPAMRKKMTAWEDDFYNSNQRLPGLGESRQAVKGFIQCAVQTLMHKE